MKVENIDISAAFDNIATETVTFVGDGDWSLVP